MELVYGMPDVDGGMCLLIPNDNFLIFSYINLNSYNFKSIQYILMNYVLYCSSWIQLHFVNWCIYANGSGSLFSSRVKFTIPLNTHFFVALLEQ